jgi:citrate/tricarballylate utilization protein
MHLADNLKADNLKEAERLMTICNACRYCEGLCAVFPALEMRHSFGRGDLNYLANLCHGCGACYVDCQFAPPHEFSVNVPKTLSSLRGDTYREYAWPKAFAPWFDRNGLTIAIVTALSIAAFILGFVFWHNPAALFSNDGQFYRLMPHRVMAAVFGAISIFTVLALVMGFRNFWKDIGVGSLPPKQGESVWQAIKDAGSLRYLDGAGAGCYRDGQANDTRRLFHHFTFYGFMLCFAATCSATIMHYVFDRPAPYQWYELPKLLGTIGGIGLVVGPIGLFREKLIRDPDVADQKLFGMDVAFLGMMFFSGLTGLLLMLLRRTPAMAFLLATHLGVVFALFLTMPYSKFVHGLYRFGALVLYAAERKNGGPVTNNEQSAVDDDT